jgi:hypothetical protein
VLPGGRAGMRPMDATLNAPSITSSPLVHGRFDDDTTPDEAVLDPEKLVITVSHVPATGVIRALTLTGMVLPVVPDAGVSADVPQEDVESL